jgi:hypothetical protein
VHLFQFALSSHLLHLGKITVSSLQVLTTNTLTSTLLSTQISHKTHLLDTIPPHKPLYHSPTRPNPIIMSNQSSYLTASTEAYAPSLKKPSSATTSRSNSTSSSRSSYCSCAHAHSSTTAYGPGYTSAQAAQDASRGSLFTAWPADEPYRAPRL